MNDDKLKKAYQSALKYYDLPDFETFKSDMMDENNLRKFRDNLSKHYDIPDFNTFKLDMGIVKKKETTVLPSVQKPKPISSGTQPKVTQKPSGTSVSGKPEGLYSAPGNALAVFKKTSDGWYVDNNRSGNFIKLQKGDVEKRVAALESTAKKFYDPTYEQKTSWQAAPSKQEVKPVSKESKITERQFEEPIGKELAQKAFDEEFFIAPKKGMSSVEQVNFVAREKAKKELGEGASEQDILNAEQKYKESGTLKMLQRKGYDVDVNGSINDPKSKKALAEFNANEDLRLKAEVKQDKLSNSIDNIVNSKLMGLTEEQAVPQLNKQFGKYGFVFEKAGLGDAMTVKYSADGITFTDAVDVDLQSGDPVEQMNLLKSFMKNKYLNDSEISALNDEKLDTKKLVKITLSNPQKYAEYGLSESQFENYITSEYRSANALKIQIDNKLSDFNKLSQQYNTTGDENILNQLRDMESSIKNDQEKLTYAVADIEQTERKYKESVGSYILQKEKQGNFIGGLFASAAKGVASAPKMLMNIGMDVLPEFLPNAGLNPLEYQKMKDEGFTDAQIQNKVSSELKRTIGKDINQGITNVGSLGTVQNEYFSSVDRNILEQAVFGLTESVGAATSGGGNAVAQGLAFFGMSYNAMQDELSSKEFDELDKWEKQAISGVYGLVIGQLEKIGFNMSAGQMKNPLLKKFTATVVKNALKDMPENATIETIDQLIGTSLKNTMRATGAKVVNGALSEGATEGIQSLAETSMKNIVNGIHDKKVFAYVPDLTTKKGIADALGSALYEAAAGAIGGAIMGSFDTYRQSRVNEQSDEKFQNMYQSLMDDNTLKAVKLNEIEKYKNGNISREQMQSNISEINTTVATLNKIPTELDTRGKRVAYELLSERDGLQSKIQGKDPNLVAAEINRIAEIDNQLKTIGENAVKESNIEEVAAEGGGIQREGTQEGQPEVGQGERAVGQATQPETDLGNRLIEGRSIKEIGDEATQEVNTYIAELGSKERIGKDVDNVISKMNNAEYINDSEINSTIDTIFNEVESINNNSDYSDQTKKALSEKLMNIAEQLDNYEFRTKTETIAFAQRGTTPSVTESPTAKVEAEKFFDGQKAEVNGSPATFTSKNGRTEAVMGNGEVIVLDTPTMKINEGDFEFDDAGSLTAVTVTDRFGTTAKFTGDIAMDLAIKQRENEIGTVEQAEFDTVYKEVETKYIKQKSPTTEVTSKEKKGPEAVVQEEAAPDIVPTEPTVAETVVEQPAAEEANVTEEVERLGKLLEGTDEQINEQVGKLRISKDNNKVAQSIANAAKSIAKILPDVKFVVHDTDESYRKATGEQNRKQSTAGEYNPKTRTIHINGTKANNRTAAHEVFHAVILEGVKNNAEAARLTKAMIDAVRKSLVNVDGAGEIISYLNDFASNYKENIQNEEKLAELFAILSDNYATLPAPTQSLIRRFLDRIAKMFGLKPLTDREVIDFMNVVSQKVARGEEIQAREIPGISRSKIKELNSRFQADFSDAVSKLTFVFDKNGDRFKKLEKDGFITRDKSLSDFNGKYIFLHQPDAAFSGMIFKDGEILVEGKGGVFYPIKFHEDGYFWASTDRTAKKMADDLNKVMEQNGGTIYMALTSAPSDKLMSSTTMANAILDFFSSKALDKNFKVTPAQLKSALRKAANDVKSINNKKVGLDLKLPATATIEEMQSAIRTALGSENSSFADRKNFAVELTKLMAGEINKNDVAVNQFGKLFSEGIQNKYFKGITKTGKLKISAANMTQALSEMFTEPMLKEGIDREKGGQVYAILELNGPVKAVKSDKHESYPMAIESANKDNKVTLHLLNDRQNWFDTFEDFETGDIVSKERQLKVYPTSGVSVQGLKVNTSKVAPETKTARKQLVAPNGKPSNLNEKQWNQVRTPEFKKWFGDWENDPKNASKVVDENGEPLVVYHGTRKSFDEFSYDVEPSNFRAGALEYSFWFTANKKNSELYGNQVMEVFLNSRNPIEIDYTNPESYREVVVPADKPRAMSISEFNEKKGNIKHSQVRRGIELRMSEDKSIDGIIHRNIKDVILSDNFQVFNPNQIKSATENIGAFSPEEKSIRKQIDNSFEARKQNPRSITSIINAARQNGFSNAAIQQYLLQQGYSQQQITNAMASVNPSGVTIDDVFKKSQEDLEAKLKSRSVKQRVIDMFRSTRRTLLNRQTDIKRALRGIKNTEAKQAYAKLVTKAGASGFAGVRFKIVSKKIYGKLKESEIEALDKIIYARRIISVNENRKAKGMNPYAGIRGYNESDAQNDLSKLRNELGDETFNKLNSRADMYFDVFSENLKKLKDSGRISEETYNNLKDVEYSPIKTIKYIIKDNYDPNDLDKEAARLGISKKDIMSLTDSNENGIITDSRWLLMMNLNMVESRVFENKMLNELVSAIENATAQEKVALSDYFILDNPIIGQFKDGRPKRRFDDEALPDGYTRVHYFKDGIDNYIIAKEAIAKQILDVKNSKITPAIEQFNEDVPILGWLVKQIVLTPPRLLRFFATGGNPFFILVNVPMDWANAVFFNKVYSHKWYEQFKVIAGVKAAWGFVKNFTKSSISKGEWNKIYMEYAEHGGLMETMSQEGLRALQEMKPTGRLAKKLPGVLSPIFKSVAGAPYKLLEGYGKAMSYLGETSEIAMRLAVYEKMKSNLIDDFKKENGVNPTGKQLDDIMWEASREARELIDFNQGGSWSKEADVFLPYFNASMQGLRKPLDYARENPVGFASSMVQLGLMAGSVAAYSIASALTAFDGDDEEERKKKVRKALDSITAREKANYHIIFTGKIDKNGELQYIRIKKLPVASIVTTGAEYLIYGKMIGYDNKEAEKQALEAAVPFWPSELKSRNPLISGLLTYAYNEDTFTGEKVFREPKNKKILPTAEGMFDDKVEGIYKALAPSLGLSPARSKAFVEKFITNESTNPTVNIIYAAANGIFDKGTTFGDEFKSMTEELLKHSERKFIRTTNQDIIRFNLQDEFEKKEMVKETELYLNEQKMYNKIKKIYDDGGSLDKEELKELVKNNFDKVNQKRALMKYYSYIKNMKIDRSLLDIVYEDVPEVQAMRLYERYGSVIENSEVDELRQIIKNSGQRLDPKALGIYKREYKGSIIK